MNTNLVTDPNVLLYKFSAARNAHGFFVTEVDIIIGILILEIKVVTLKIFCRRPRSYRPLVAKFQFVKR